MIQTGFFSSGRLQSLGLQWTGQTARGSGRRAICSFTGGPNLEHRNAPMTDYDLYYWSVPFRGQFVRAVLTHAGKTWTERGDAAIAKLMEQPTEKMPAPFMG